MKNCLKRPLAKKSQWRHIRLAIKPRYLGNHASQIKSHYGSISGNHSRSFRIRHKTSRDKALPGGGLTIMSYPVGNTTSLSRKPCIVAKMLLWIINWKSRSLFQNPSWKRVCSVPSGGLTMTLCPVGNKTSLSRKPCKKLLWITIMKSWSLSNFKKQL